MKDNSDFSKIKIEKKSCRNSEKQELMNETSVNDYLKSLLVYTKKLFWTVFILFFNLIKKIYFIVHQ